MYQIKNHFCGPVVQIAGWLVGHQHRRPGYQRSGQGYPFSLGAEYIAVSPAAAPVGASVRVWGSCGCGEGGTPAPGAPVETVRLWLLDARPLVVTRQKHRRVVNAGHALLGTATIDSRSNWSARVIVPTHIDAGAGPPGRTTTTPGIYAIMVTYPGEEAATHYYAVAPREGYITRFVVTPFLPRLQRFEQQDR